MILFTERHYHDKKIAWHRVTDDHIASYKNELDDMLDEMEIPPCILHCNDIGCTERLHHDAINDICNNLIDMCLVPGGHCFPRVKAGVKGKPGWNSSVKGLRTDSLFWHSVWVSCGEAKLTIGASKLQSPWIATTNVIYGLSWKRSIKSIEKLRIPLMDMSGIKILLKFLPINIVRFSRLPNQMALN